MAGVILRMDFTTHGITRGTILGVDLTTVITIITMVADTTLVVDIILVVATTPEEEALEP